MSIVSENGPTERTVSRFWCFTWFPPTGVLPMENGVCGAGEDVVRVENYDVSQLENGKNWPTCSVGKGEAVTSLIFQNEICPETGRHHIQGYAEFSKPIRFTQAIALAQIKGAHLSERYKRSSRDDCAKYCVKTDTRKPGTNCFILGEMHAWVPSDDKQHKGKQGKRTDIERAVDLIKSGKRMIDVVAECSEAVVKYSRGMQEISRIYRQSQTMRIRTELRTTVLYGDAGTGKTRSVYEEHGVENVFTLVADNGACWFDGYEGQSVLLIDDFNGWVQFSNLLKVLDIYPYRGAVKGSFTYAAWTRVYITSNYEWDSWYNQEHNKDALFRRIHKIVKFRKLPSGVVQRITVKDADKQIGMTLPRTEGEGASAGAGSYAPGFTPVALTYLTPIRPAAPATVPDDDETLSDDEQSESA